MQKTTSAFAKRVDMAIKSSPHLARQELQCAVNEGRVVLTGVVGSMWCQLIHISRLVLAQSANRRSRGWLHPSLQSRIDFLLRTAHDARRASVFNGRVRLAGYLLMGMALVPLCLLMWIS